MSDVAAIGSSDWSKLKKQHQDHKFVTDTTTDDAKYMYIA